MWIAVVMALAACSDKGDTTATGTTSSPSGTTATTSTGTTACTAEIASIEPADGAAGVPVDATVTATFTEPAPSADIGLYDPTGAQVPGTLSLAADGLSATFTPDAALDWETEYLVEVEVCQVSATTRFTTIAQPLGADDLEGNTYAIDLNTVTWIHPTAKVIDTLIALAGGLPADQLLLQVDAVTPPDVPDTIEFLGALGSMAKDGTISQYACAPVFDFDPADFTANPAFVIGPSETQLIIDTAVIPMTNLVIQGVFSGDGSEIVEGRVTSDLDVREMDEQYGICALLELMTGGKETCYDCGDGVVGCATLELEVDSMPMVPGLAIDPAIDTSGC